MSGLIYIYKRTFINRLKKALRKPVTYVYLAFGIIYLLMMFSGFGTMFSAWNLASPQGLVTILSVSVLFFLPTNMITYAKRKGLLFRPSDVHFVFTSPVQPKLVLLYVQVKQFLISFLASGLFTWVGVSYFKIAVWKMILYFLLSFVVENVLETSLMIFLYGNERFSERTVKAMCKSLYLMIGVLVLFAGYLYFVQEKSFTAVEVFLNHPFVQCVPILGWNIAFIRLLILGPTTLNVICTVLYCLSAAGFLITVVKMKCTGDYYEDAMKFADDYQEARNKQKKGETTFRIGRKKKFKKASVTYKGSYAKAIFYRQLLEYKKQRFFIFGSSTIVCLIASIVIAYAVYHTPDMNTGMMKYFLLPGAGAYITFMFSGYLTRWSKELENPYTFLIPDTPFRKLMYSTLIEHIRSLIDGCVLVIPAAVFMGLPLLNIILAIFLYMCLQANKLYFSVLSEAVLGDVLGNTGKTILRMAGQMLMITLAVIVAAAVSIFSNITWGFLAMCIYALIVTVFVAVGGSTAFSKMEVS